MSRECLLLDLYAYMHTHYNLLVLLVVSLHTTLNGFSISGALAASVSCPLDVVKTRVQGAKLGSKAAEESTLSVMREIITTQGPRYLFKGLLPRIYVVPSMMSLFYVFDEVFKQIALDKFY